MPLGLASFAHDLQGIRAYADRDHAALTSWHTYDRGGHYAARQEPDLVVADIRDFFATVLAKQTET